MREYLIAFSFTLKTDTPEAIEDLIHEAMPDNKGVTIIDLNPNDLKDAALWAARSCFEEMNTSQMIWYVENLTVTSVKSI